MVSLYEDLLLGGDWGDLFASESADDKLLIAKVKDEQGGEDSFLPDLLGSNDSFPTVDLGDDFLGQSEWMTTWTDLLNVPPSQSVDPVEEILQQAERSCTVESEVTNSCQTVSDSFIVELLQEATPSVLRSPSPVDEVPALISFDNVTPDQFSPLSPPLSPEDIDSILSGPSSPLSDASGSDMSVSFLDDPDWMPSEQTSPTKLVKTFTKLRPKPYEKVNVVESKTSVHLSKKERKREQNKNAAIRYREKKRAESEVVFGEEKGLEDKNKLLKNKVESMTNEISYLKNLLREVYKAKGLKLDQKLL